MKILLLHTDYIKFKALKKALKSIGELSEKEKEEHLVKEALVVLTAVEKRDSDTKKIVEKLVESIADVVKQVKAERVVLYPYAHLSSDLASPEQAIEVLNEAEKELKKKFDVVKAPFGYYKEFEFKVKGHPLSELSRELIVEDGKAVVKEEEFTDEMRKKLLNKISTVKLDTSRLKENDHRIIGQQMGLFMFHDTAPGMPYWLPAGLTIYNELINFWREEHKKRGYQEIVSPLMNKKEIYKISGHWDHYKENMFIAHTDEDEDYCLKPMNCPNAMLVFKMQPRSYKELPLRLSDTDRLHRFERSGTLNGLLRVRGFQQDDSHNFITEDMIKSEYEAIFEICEKFYSIFNLKYSFRLGTRPESFLGEKKTWDKAETALKEVLEKSGKKFTILERDGAFYGPKVDILMKDSQGREWQMGTMQLDFQLPQRFELKYTDKDGKEKTPVVIHRVIYGSLERFMGVLIEHLNGRFPTWLAPVQVKILNFTDRNTDYAKKIFNELQKEIPNLRVECDFRQTTVPSKVKDAEIMRVPYIIVIGDKEEKEKKLAVRVKGSNKIEIIGMKEFVEKIKKEIQERI